MSNDLKSISGTKLYEDFYKALRIQDMRADDNPFVVRCCEIAEKYAKDAVNEALSIDEVLKSINEGTHPQFTTNEDGHIICKCGHNAVEFRGGFICGTVTAYPCSYNKQK